MKKQIKTDEMGTNLKFCVQRAIKLVKGLKKQILALIIKQELSCP